MSSQRLRSISILIHQASDMSVSVMSVAPRDFAEQMRCVAEMGGVSQGEDIESRTCIGY